MNGSQVQRQAEQRGAAVLGFMGVGLMAFLGLAVVGVDWGHLGLSVTEVQTVADAAATAGARSLLLNERNGAAEDPVVVAQAVVSENRVDGDTASIAASDVEVGTYDFDTQAFSAGGASPNAVRAIATATVPNTFAGIFGDATTDVTREAVAAYSGNASAAPVCPITVGLCQFRQYQSSADCSDLPTLTQAPSGSDSSGWTSLGPDSASASGVISYLPAECGGGGEPAPTVRVGDWINVLNGQANSVLKTMRDCFNAGLLTECVIPITDTPCNVQFNRAKQIVGFATMKIERIKATGNPKGIDLEGLCSADEPGAPGGPDLGTASVSMVR